MLQAVVSSSARARLLAAADFVRRAGPATEMVVIGATREAADDFCRALAIERGGAFGLHRFTPGQFAARTSGAALAARGLSPSTPLGADALAARAAFEVRRVAPLDYLEPVAQCPGFPRALASTLRELREAGMEAAAVAALPAPGPDLARLLDEHGRQLAAARVADRAALLHETARLLRARAPGVLAGLPVLLLDVAIRSHAERAVVAALAETAPAALITVPTGDERTLALLPPHVVATPPDPDPEPSGLARVRAYLFSDSAPAAAATGDVQFFSAPGEGRECVEVARRILAEAARGVPFDRMAVVVRTPETYWGPLEQALTRAGIPAWYARGVRRPDPTGRAFLALLACAGEGLSARRFSEYLSLGQVPRRDERGAPAPDPPPFVVSREETLTAGQLSLLELLDRAPTEPVPGTGPGTGPGTEAEAPRDVRTPWKWEALLVESSVVGGAGRWRRRLGGLAHELERRLAEADSDEPGSGQSAAIRRDLDALDDLSRFALPLIDDLAALPASALWGEWLERLSALAPRALRHPARVLELLADLRPMASVGPLTLAEVRQVLVPRLSTLEREPPRQRAGRVFVGAADHLRGRSFTSVFVTGLAERVFPQRARQDPLLLDVLRARLGRALAVEDDRVVAERLLLRVAVGAAAERLFLSYPRMDVSQARPRVPSFYALDVMRALTGVVPDHETFERDTALATGAWLAWPAPDAPETAIDTWEHDLAVLGPMLKPGVAPDSVRGHARYLLDLEGSEHLARSLRARWARWKRRWSPSDGLIAGGEAVQTLLDPQRLTKRAYSASALQRYASCPYQFLLGAIYRFEPLDRPAPLVQLDPLTRGALFHEVQRDVLRALAAAELLPLSPERLGRARQLLDEAFAQAMRRAYDELAPAIDRVWEDETGAMLADLRLWIRRMADAGGEWIPKHFELSFGLKLDDEHDPSSVAAVATIGERFSLRGAIDLIEEHAVFGWLRVTDHKTGRNRTQDHVVVGGGATLQPVLYGLAAEQILGRTVKQARLAFVTTAGGFTDREVSLRDAERRSGVEVLEIIDRAVEAGALPPAPREGACGFCDFRPVCGPLEERRFRDKPKDEGVIADLIALRRMR